MPFTWTDAFQIMIEDTNLSGGVPGDAYFDNISLVPEASSMTLALIGLITTSAGVARMGSVERQRIGVPASDVAQS